MVITKLNSLHICVRYDLEHNQVVICSQKCSTLDKVSTILSHELVHMYDHCVAKVDWNDIYHLACSEVSSYTYFEKQIEKYVFSPDQDQRLRPELYNIVVTYDIYIRFEQQVQLIVQIPSLQL